VKEHLAVVDNIHIGSQTSTCAVADKLDTCMLYCVSIYMNMTRSISALVTPKSLKLVINNLIKLKVKT